MRIRFAPALLAFLFFAMANPSVFSQKNDRSPDAEKLWQLIATQLDQRPADTSRQYILLLVRGQCGDDLACQFEIYEVLRKRLERERFDLPAAIFITEEMVRVAQKEKNHKNEGSAHLNLFRFYESRGNFSECMRSLDNALKSYERAGEKSSALHCKFVLEELRFRFEPFDTVYSGIRLLIEEAEQSRDRPQLTQIHHRLMQVCFDLGQFGLCEKHLQAMETLVPYSDSTKSHQIFFHALTTQYRARLAIQKNDRPEAIKYWLRSLHWARKIPDRWQESNASLMLANLEWQSGQPVLAKKHLEKAEKIATESKIDEFLAKVFSLKSIIAEAEGKPAQSLEFLKKEIFHQAEFKKRSAGFDFEKHFLRSQTEKIEQEKVLQKADLELKNLQLIGSGLFLLLVLAVAVGLFRANRFQKKAGQKLTEQNALIQKQSEELQSLDAAKSQFFANVSHELRTPLALILGPIASLLKENQLAEKQKRLLKMAAQNGSQLQHLVNEILDLGKLEAGKMTVNAQPTELLPFFHRHLAQFESLAAAHRVHFSFEILIPTGATAKIDQSKYRQILSNLLANAFKFTPAGGWIRASLSLKNGQICLEIADSGAGIHPGDLPHLFERYFQTNQIGKPARGGTGIGLALCREHAQLLGGKIWAESVPGEGSTFFVSLPVLLENGVSETEKPVEKHEPEFPILEKMDAPPPVSNVEKALKSVLRNEKPRLLVVEDNPELQEYLRIVLEEKYQIEVAENGQVALEKIAGGGNFQLIVSDLMMPVLDGRQLAEKLKSDDATRHLPFIMLTARAGAADKLEALRLGVDDYLSKPFVEEELLARIENLLKNQNGRQQFFEKNQPETDAPVFSKEDQTWLADFEKYVEKHLADPDLAIPRMASDFAMSESSLLRQLKRLTGLSAIQYLQESRLDKARLLLENRVFKNLEKVVAAVGYGDVRNFSRSYKKRFGKTPSDYLHP